MKKRKKRAFYAAWATTLLCGTALLLGITKGTKTKAATGTPITGGMTITESGDYYLESDVTGSIVIDSDIDVVLDLNGYVLSRTGTGSVIKLSNGGTLTIKDSRPETTHPELENVYSTGGIITGGNTEFGGGIHVIGATLVLESGTITNNQALYGAGIYVGTNGLVQIKGAKITGNIATIPEGSDKSPLGGGLYANNSTVQMSGGSVSYNSVQNNEDSTGACYGGGMYIIGDLEMSDGDILNNQVSNNANGQQAYGGGVYIKGNLTLSGGSIANNQLFVGTEEGYCCGAGVYLRSGAVIMSDGYISGNKAYARKDSKEFGGGIYSQEGEVKVSGGVIANNEAGNGGGLYNSASAVFSGGSVFLNMANNGGGIFNSGSLEITAGEVSRNNSIYYGGGVYSTGAFTMKGGTLSYNRCVSNNGGGAWVKGESTLIGGKITKNSADKGGGVYVEEKTTVGGTIQITDNVSGGMIYDNEGETLLSGGTPNNLYLPKDTVVVVGTEEKAPSSGMHVGITTQTKPTQDEKVAISEANAADCHSCFFADGAMKEDVLYRSDDFLLYLAVPIISVTQNGENPIYKTALEEDGFYTVSCENFGDEPTCKLEWKYEDEGGVSWKEDAPETTLAINKEGDVTTTAETPAGNYSFRITNGQPEWVEDPDSTATPKEMMVNPLFVSSGEVVFTVGKKEQTITAALLQNVSYGDTDKAVTASAVGTLGFSVKSGTSVAIDSTDGSLTISDLGDTVITIEAGATDNYYAATLDITVRVDKKKLSKPSENAGAFTYTGTEQTYLPVGYDASVMQIDGNKKTAANPTGYTVTVTPKYGYEWNEEGDCSFIWKIAKAPLLVTAKSKNISFNEDATDNGVEYDGFVNGETETVLNGTLTYSYLTTGATPKPYMAGDPLGTYRIVPGGLASDNYEITFQNGTLTVAEKVIDKPQPVNRTYTYTGTEQTIELTGFDAETMNISTERSETAAGTYTVHITPKEGFCWSTEGDCSPVWIIEKAALTANASSHTVEYGATVPNYTVSYTGFKNGEETPTTEPVLTSAYTAESATGRYEVTFSAEPVFANYAVTAINGVVTVKRAVCATEPTITDRTYNGEVQTGILRDGAFVVLEGVSTATDAGNYRFTATPDSNHAWEDGSFETKSYDWMVEKITVEAPDVEGNVYNGELLTATVDDTDRPYRVTKNDGGIDAGNYDVVLTLRDAVNYKWTDSDAESKTLVFTISKADNTWLTEPSVDSVTYNTAISPIGSAEFGDLSVSYVGIDGTDYNSDTVPCNAGKYEAVFTVEETGNYGGLSKTVEFSIAKKSIDGATVVYEDTKVYNGQIQYFSVSSVEIDGISAAFSVTDNAARDCSDTEYRMTITGTGNFEGIITKTFRITKASVTKPEADSTVFVYNGNSRQYYLPGNDRYIISGNYQRNAGTYQVVVTLKDKNNCEWKDGSSSNLYYSFVIAKAPNAIHNLTVGTDTDCPELPSATADFGTVQFVYATAEKQLFDIDSMPTEPGRYIVRAYVEGNDNYESAYSEKEFTITEPEDPTGEDPSGEDPTGEDPTGEDPSGEDPTGEDPSGEDPSGEDPTGEDPSGEDPSGEDPSGEDPSEEDPSGEDPSGEDPSGEDPSGENPSGEDPMEKDPVEDPSGEDPSGEDPSGEDPTGEDPMEKDPVEDPIEEPPKEEEPIEGETGKNPSKEHDTTSDSPEDKTEIPQVYDPKLAPVEDLTLEVTLDEESSKTCKALLNKFEKIGDVYDVRLMKNGQEIQPQELGEGMTVIVRIPVPKKMTGRKFRLVHMHSSDDVGLIVKGNEPGIGTYVIDENGYLVTKVDRLSKFVYLYQPKCYLHWAALALLGAYVIAYALFCLLSDDKTKLLITAILLEIAEILIAVFAGCVYCYIIAGVAFVFIGICTARRLHYMPLH